MIIIYRLLIVDDEKLIVDGMLEIVQRSKYLELDTYKAYSVHEAIQIMNKIKIDIVITDVSMPGMSGIELHEQIRRSWPFCRVIYLTSYNHFEYVQSAIRNDGTDFVLKTEGEERILEALSKAIRFIEDSFKNQKYLERAQRQMEIATPLLQKNFLLELAGGIECTLEERERQFAELGISLNAHVGIFMIIGLVDKWPKEISFTEKMKNIYLIQNIISQHLSGLVMLVPVTLDDSSTLWIIQPMDLMVCDEDFRAGKNVWQRVVSIVHGIMDSAQKTIREVIDVPVSFIVSRYPSSWENISETFDRMKYTLNSAAGVSQEVLWVDEDELNEISNEKDEERVKIECAVRLQIKKIAILEKYLHEGQSEEFMDAFKLLMENMKKLVDVRDNIAVDVYYSIAAIFTGYIFKNKLINQSTLEMTVNLDKLTKIEEHISWDKMSEYFVQLAEFIFSHKAEEHLMSTRNIIDRVYTYIQQNPEKDLSLNKLSEISRFSPFYLSRLYKQMTGKSISEHVLEVKLAKAKELLGMSSMKINEISTSLGFCTPSYFTCFFKRNTNMNPQEYRDLKG